MARYTVVFEKAKSNWAAYVADLPGCITTGATLKETRQNIREAIELHLEVMREVGETPPRSYESRMMKTEDPHADDPNPDTSGR